MYSYPPDLLSRKDLLYLEDMLAWNLNLVKKSSFYAGCCQDTAVKKALQDMCRMHQDHYNDLLDHLNHHMNQNTVSGQIVKGDDPHAGTEQQFS